MKPITIGICLATILAVLSRSSVGSAQGGNQWPRAWAHAYVSRVDADVFLTHVEGEGCEDRKVEITQFRVSSNDTQAMASEITRLGNGGWQMIGEGTAYCHSENRKAFISSELCIRPASICT